jgi:hypothetical protein
VAESVDEFLGLAKVSWWVKGVFMITCNLPASSAPLKRVDADVRVCLVLLMGGRRLVQQGKFAFTDYLARVKAQEGQEYDVVSQVT